MPTVAEAMSLAIAHHQAGRLEVAEGIYRQILAAEPAHADALHLLGVAVHQRGQHLLAIELLTQAIAWQPADARYHNNLGQVYSALGRDAEAIASYRRAVELSPGYAVAHNNLGSLLRAAGNPLEAIACYRQALEANPDYAEAWNNLANAWRDQGQLDAAVDGYRRALEINPALAQTHCNLGLVLQQLGKPGEAAACCRRALELRPDLAEAHYNLGNALRGLEQTDQAAACYRRAVELRPDYADAWSNLAATLKDQALLGEAIACYRRVAELKPDDPAALSNLLYTLSFSADYDAQAIGAAYRQWEERHAAPRARFIVPYANERSPERRLRVGYVSPDFRQHVQAQFTVPLFSAHDHGRFEIFAYADVPRPDHVTERLRGLCDAWCNSAAFSEEQLAERIRQDQIDILVDLTMHMAGNRLPVFARRPAPVQACWLAYPGTTGLSAIDYRLTDRHLDPPGLHDAYYTEHSIPLPDAFWCYDPLATEPDVNRLPALDRGCVTFGSLNNFCKVDAPFVRLWAQVLRRVEGSRMVLMAVAGSHRQRIGDLFHQEGVGPDRVTFFGERSRGQYLALYQGIDVGLDTFPYNGHTTSLDALWMGVPVVSLAGRTAVGRGGLSILSNVGLPDFVAHDADQYVRIAAALAGDLPRLAQLRAALRARMQASPLMDAPRFARNLEDAYRTMWRGWCAKQAPRREASPVPSPLPPAPQSGSKLAETLALALTHHQAGRLDEAEELYRRIVAVEPARADAWNLLGIVAQRRGQYAAAVERIGQAVTLAPTNPAYRNSLGEAYRAGGRLAEAAACYQAALALKADFAEAHCNWGVVLEAEGKLDEAAARFRQALALNPDLAEAHSNLGCVLQRQGKLDEAIACHRRGLQLTPGFAYAHNNLGETYRVKGDLAAAAACFRRAIELTPDVAEMHSNFGAVLHRQGRLDEAEACYRRAIALNPNLAEAHGNLGNVWKDQGRLDEALQSYRRAVAIAPQSAAAHSDLLYTMYLSPRCDAATIYEELGRWNRAHAQPLAHTIRAHAKQRSSDRRLRIGYVSPDLRGHPVGRFLLPLVEAHDHRQFEIFCYSSVLVPDATTDRLRAAADVWREVPGLSDEQLAEAIGRDRIEILVDLSMHTAHSRLLVFARKPAPVQVTYLAYCGSTGLEAIDYRLTDPYLDPPGGEERFYSEQSIRLPETYWCYRPPISTPPVNGLPAAGTGYVTFGCLNNFCKVSEPAFAAWIRLLHAVPGSRLLLHTDPGSHCDRLRDALAREGVAPERLAFANFLPMQDYFQAYQRIDVGLDPFPFGGGTTTCDALWMGVPVVSLAGRTAVGRGGLSILSNVGLPDLAAHDTDQYVRIAAALAGDLPRLAQLRATLRERMQASPLMDAPRFARNVEAAYRTMWRRWCAG